MLLPTSMRQTALSALQALAAAKSCSPDDLIATLESTPKLRQLLIDQLDLGTTWFRREWSAVEQLVESLRKADRREVWVWCAGCSSGEEPYSLAMALSDLGIDARILATDVNRRALRTALDGSYPERGLQHLPESWREKYVDVTSSGGFQVKYSVRRMVTFELHNFASTGQPPKGWSQFDAVVCRNALIYFERGESLRIIAELTRSCRPGGSLLLGAIERPLLWLLDDDADAHQVSLLQVPRRIRTKKRASTVVGPAPTPAQAIPRHRPSRTEQPTVELPRARNIGHARRLMEDAAQCAARGDTESAVKKLDEALECTPLLAVAHLRRGLLLRQQGSIAEAIVSLRTARFLDDYAWFAPYQLASCLEEMGSLDDAREAYRHALVVLESGGPSGLDGDEVDGLESTAASVCRVRLRTP